ncbi:hypothetical protein [Methanosarcina barkeri]|uniref:hypothetical protein n=1 Tax=Methanosarcina barkeri TaxID=2208 RepID=UPI00064F26CC|nr:hypothetical protein [Methanosarcina barkeri]
MAVSLAVNLAVNLAVSFRESMLVSDTGYWFKIMDLVLDNQSSFRPRDIQFPDSETLSWLTYLLLFIQIKRMAS